MPTNQEKMLYIYIYIYMKKSFVKQIQVLTLIPILPIEHPAHTLNLTVIQSLPFLLITLYTY